MEQLFLIYPLFVRQIFSPDIFFPARYGLTNEICYTCPGTVVAPKVQTSTRLSWIPNAFRITEQVEQLTYHRLEDGIQESRRALHYSKLSAVIGHGVCCFPSNRIEISLRFFFSLNYHRALKCDLDFEEENS